MISAFGVDHGGVSKAWSAPRKQGRLSSALTSEGAKRTPSQNPTVREDYLTARIAGAERGKSDTALGLRRGDGYYAKGERVEALAQHSRAVKNSRTRFEPKKARAQKQQAFYRAERVRRTKKLVKLGRATWVSKVYLKNPTKLAMVRLGGGGEAAPTQSLVPSKYDAFSRKKRAVKHLKAAHKQGQTARPSMPEHLVYGGSEVGKAYGRGPALDAARWTVGLAGTGAAGGGAVYGEQRARGRKKDTAKKVATAAVLGGAAGQGVYQAAGYEAKHRAMRAHQESGMGRAQTDKKLKAAKKAHGAFTNKMYRNYPKDLPGAKIHRVLGWTHRGKTGTAAGAAVTFGASALAVKAALRSKENR